MASKFHIMVCDDDGTVFLADSWNLYSTYADAKLAMLGKKMGGVYPMSCTLWIEEVVIQDGSINDDKEDVQGE